MTSLDERRDAFLAASTISMPLAGLIVWSAIGVVALFVPDAFVGWMAIYAMAAILPLAFAIEKLRGRNPFAKDDNPVSTLFFQSIIGIGLMFPLVIGASLAAGEPTIMVLGVAILAGVIWIPYGWGANDPVGLRHAVLRAVGAYAAYWLAPDALKAPAICAVVSLAYPPCVPRERSSRMATVIPNARNTTVPALSPTATEEAHNPAGEASDCVRVIYSEDFEVEHVSTTQKAAFRNRCSRPVEVSWCTVSGDCRPGYTNLATVPARKDRGFSYEPSIAGSKVAYAACYNGFVQHQGELSKKLLHACK